MGKKKKSILPELNPRPTLEMGEMLNNIGIGNDFLNNPFN